MTLSSAAAVVAALDGVCEGALAQRCQ